MEILTVGTQVLCGDRDIKATVVGKLRWRYPRNKQILVVRYHEEFGMTKKGELSDADPRSVSPTVCRVFTTSDQCAYLPYEIEWNELPDYRWIKNNIMDTRKYLVLKKKETL